MSVERQLMMSSGGVQQYTISNSLRFRASASAYLSRTYTSNATWTLSIWCKRGILGAIKPILGSAVKFNANDTLTAGSLTTTAVYRDPSSWYHIVVSNSGCYINSVSIGSVTTSALTNASIGSDGTNYFDGYMADINFIDGQALTPSSFGETSSTTGVWIPKKYTGSYGTNGFYLNFNNNTSTTALGYDTSGNGNNWTPNNFSLTTGATYDSMIDSPTSYASGANNVGNYAVLNGVNKVSTSTLSDANLTVAWNSFGGEQPASFAVSSGKWYWELTTSNQYAAPGIIPSTAILSASSFSNGYHYYGASGYFYTGTTGIAYGATLSALDVIGVALDLDINQITFYKNGASQGAKTIVAGQYSPDFAAANSVTLNANFGQRPFAYTPPSGYNALNTYNLSTPSIVDGSKQFAASLYTGTGSSLSVSGANFTPGMVWVKSRSAATDHALYDVIRGTQARLESNTTDAEVTSDNGVTAFNSTGFTVGTLAQVNTSSATYVGWQWKANGTAVTNTAGSITSSVSANQTAGFSVVTWTNPASGTSTVGHGLGVTPSLIILKGRNIVSGWSVYHASVGNTGRLVLNTTAATDTSSTYWNNTSPTSSVFTLGTGFADSSTRVAYCFAAIPGYSAFGSYTGNGSSDGPFVFLGFRPRWIMLKRTDSTSDWIILDTSRNTYNVMNASLWADLSSAEGTYTICDYLSNGFKLRDASNGYNTSSGTYIYAAFAENPFKYSLAR